MSDDALDKTLIRDGPTTEQVELPASVPLGKHIRSGEHFGRYVILDRLASGGMGEVYAAWDPNLDRKVALKILRTDLLNELGASQGKTRLLREAQAMARLSHPNIVTVHDVGTSAGEVFIAMEFLDGAPLRDWMNEKQRPWSEVLPIFIDAGRGLAAAHKAGIVHRDFKPMNVIVGRSGRVCVLDFGIARSADSATLPQAPASEPSKPPPENSQPLELLTIAGAVVGTPGYMSPEQYRGEPVDTRTDQFSFCVALYEALYGRRPFNGANLDEFKKATESGVVPDPPADTDAPDWLPPILKRGMAPKPADRFASMDELLLALSSSPRAHRRARFRRLAIAAAIVGVAASAAVVRALAPNPCPPATNRWTDVWDRARQQKVKASFLATKKPYADAAFEEVNRLLRSYRDGWLAEHHEVCLAARVRKEQSDELMDRRMACLSLRLSEVEALTELFQRADGELVANAIRAVGGVTPTSSCSVAAVLASSVRAPDPAVAPMVPDLRADLVAVNALIEAGLHEQARTELEGLRGRVNAVAYEPLTAQHLMLSARLLEAGGDFRAAVPLLHQAAIAAQSANDTETLFRAWTMLARVEGVDETKIEQGLLFGRYAAAALSRTSKPPELEAELQSVLGVLERDAVRYDKAIAHENRAVELLTQAFGPKHPRVGQALHALAWTESWAGNQQTATRHSREALAILEASYGKHHPAVARVLSELGSIEDELGDFQSAVKHLEEGLRIREEIYGPDHLMVAQSMNLIALTFPRVGRVDEASRYAERALEIMRKTVGSHGMTSKLLHTLAEVRLAQGRYEEALKLTEEGLVLVRKHMPDTIHDGYQLTTMGEALLQMRQPKAAVAKLEQALERREGREQLPLELGKTRSALARALKASGGDRARAEALAEQARKDFAASGPKGQIELARLDDAFPAL